MECKNKHVCSCQKTTCKNHGVCCDCIAAHGARNSLPTCMRDMIDLQKKDLEFCKSK